MVDSMLYETDNGFELTHTGWRLGSCTLSWAVVLTLWHSQFPREVTIRIEPDFELIYKGVSTAISPPKYATLAPLLALINRDVKSLKALKSGILEIKFQGDFLIIVPPDLLYEAWELTSEDAVHIVCVPGGNLAVFNYG